MHSTSCVIGYRKPAKLVVLDGKTGKEISINAMTGDADLYYDEKQSINKQAKLRKHIQTAGHGFTNKLRISKRVLVPEHRFFPEIRLLWLPLGNII
jgi:hypothetical protein